MTGGKKWVLVITDEQSEWLQGVSKRTDLKGSDIIREMMSNIMEDDKKFIASLANAQFKIEMQKLNDEKAAIAERERELRKQYSGEKVTA